MFNDFHNPLLLYVLNIMLQMNNNQLNLNEKKNQFKCSKRKRKKKSILTL